MSFELGDLGQTVESLGEVLNNRPILFHISAFQGLQSVVAVEVPQKQRQRQAEGEGQNDWVDHSDGDDLNAADSPYDKLSAQEGEGACVEQTQIRRVLIHDLFGPHPVHLQNLGLEDVLQGPIVERLVGQLQTQIEEENADYLKEDSRS